MKIKHSARLIPALLVILLTFSLLFGCAPATQKKDAALTVIHINDRHGRMGADAYISQLAKDTVGNVLILDAGDGLHGQITANLSEGAAMVELMNEVGYSAMTIGNHEFNYGVERLQELAELANFPLLAANVKGADGENLFQSCFTFQMDGVKVGVFGLATPETIASSDPRLMAGLTFDDPVQTAKAEVAELKSDGCDVIIALTHMGLDKLSDPKDRSDTLAEKVPGIDVIIDGHSHTALPDGITAGDTLIAQTGEYGQNIGVVEIKLSGGTVSKTAKIIPVPADDEESDDETPQLAPDETILAKIAELDAVNEEITSAVVGNTPVFLQGEKTEIRTGQSNLADLITDSMRFVTGADIAFMTGGNIRASIDAGEITMGEVLTTMPYSNLLTTVELTGADILKILEHGVDMYPEAVGHYIHVSGLRFTFDPEAEAGSRVKTVTTPDGGSLLPDKAYTVATIDFIAAGGDGYDVMANGKDLTYYGGDAEAFIGYLATNPKISAEAEGRVLAAGGETREFRSLADFEGARIGALVGTVFAEFIDPIVPDVKYTYYPSQAELAAAMSRGEVDAIALDMPVAKYLAAQNAEFAVFSETVAPDGYGFALAKGSPLAAKANAALQKLRNDGTIAELEKIWFSADETSKVLTSLDYKDNYDGSAGTLRYGCDNSTDPMSYINTAGEPVGFDLDIVGRIAYELNMKVEFIPMSFDKLFAALASGEVDMVGGSMSLTKERKDTYDCIGPYYDGGVVLVVKK